MLLVTLTSRKDPAHPITATFPVVVPTQRLHVREVTEAARKCTDPDAAATAYLRAWSAAMEMGVPELAAMFTADTGLTFAKLGRSGARLGDEAYDYFVGVHHLDDEDILAAGNVVVTAFTEQAKAWAAEREVVAALGKDSGAQRAPTTASSPG